MNYFEFYPGDYQRDTTDLSLAEHGAYLLLLSLYYSTGEPLPADLTALYRVCRAMTSKEQTAVKLVANRFFPVGVNGLRNNARADAEISKAKRRIETAKANGGKGGRPKKENPAGIPAGNPLGIPAETQRGTQRGTHSGEALQTPHAIELTPPNGGVVPGKPAPPACPHSDIVALYHEILPELTRVRDWGEDRQALLRSRWREDPRRQSLGWWRKFFEYVHGCPFLMGQEASGDRVPFFADLEWLIRPKNFRKVIEGKYQQRRAA